MPLPTHSWIDGLIHAVFRTLSSVSPQTGDRIAGRLGPLFYRLDRRHRRIALDNLQRAFGDVKSTAEIESIARTVFGNLIRILFEIAWSLYTPLDTIRQSVRVRGHLNFFNALRNGRGVLMLTAHAGNWELLPILGALAGVRANVLYRPLDAPPLERFIVRLRSRFGARLIPTARAARKVLNALHKGEIVAVLMDQNVDWYEGVFVDFFGHRACTNKGLALIALKTKAPVVPVFMARENGGYLVEVGRQLPLIRTGDKTTDLEANTQQYNDVIEDFVRRYPDQWFWVHQRWKTRPYQPWPRRDG